MCNNPLDVTCPAKLIYGLKQNIPIIKQIPKGENYHSRESIKSIRDCLSTNSLAAWTSLMMFPFACLRVPKKQCKASLTCLVKNNVKCEQLPKIKQTEPESRLCIKGFQQKLK